MPKHSFSLTKRYAIFEAHEYKCFWCRRPVEFKDMNVDHMVPESLAATPEALKEFLTFHGLAPDFNLNDYPNLVASCGDCNNRKSDIQITAPIMIVHIRNAGRCGEKAQAFEAKLTKQLTSDKGVGKILSALEAGKVSLQSVIQIIFGNRFHKNVHSAPVIEDASFIELIHRGGVLMGFVHICLNDYQALAFSADCMLFRSDSYYTLDEWTELLELASVEPEEIEYAREQLFHLK